MQVELFLNWANITSYNDPNIDIASHKISAF